VFELSQFEPKVYVVAEARLSVNDNARNTKINFAFILIVKVIDI